MNTPDPSVIDRAELAVYRVAVAERLAGRGDAQRFIAQRLLLGVYAQRQDGLTMVRTKLPGGRLRAAQLRGYAEALEHHARTPVVHLTTRQDIQFHGVPLARTPALLESLADHGIGSREAGGNTVRNVSACALAGVCPAEHTNASGYAVALATHFIGHPLTHALPRKFKISVSGCNADCAQGAQHDLALIAAPRDGRPGFRLLAGGGLGAKPHTAVELAPWIAPDDLVTAVEAVLVLHDRHSDRSRRARSRIKFLVADLGADEFRRRWQGEFERLAGARRIPAPDLAWRSAVAPARLAPGRLRAPVLQHQSGRAAVPIAVPRGALDARQLRGLADRLEHRGLTELRVTQEQNLVVLDVPTTDITALAADLAELGLGLPQAGDNVVACAGTATCTLGITASQPLARLLGGGASDLGVRVSGCHNRCANSDGADIGLWGKARHQHGQLVPTYVVQLGGSGRAGDQYAFDAVEIPAARIPAAVRQIEAAYADDRSDGEDFGAWARRKGRAWFVRRLARLTQVSETELPFLVRDHGDSRSFRVDAHGSGECAGTQETPDVKRLLDARYDYGLALDFAARGKWEIAAESLAAALAHLHDTGSPPGDTHLDGRLTEFVRDPDELGWPALADAVEQQITAAQAALAQHPPAARPGHAA